MFQHYEEIIIKSINLQFETLPLDFFLFFPQIAGPVDPESCDGEAS